MSSDHYPTCDVRGLELPPARLDPLGAASLLYRNADDRWPEFAGQDLEGAAPGVAFSNLTEDGAMIGDVLTDELTRLGHGSGDRGIVVTLTAGGNDLLDALLGGRLLDRAVDQLLRRYTELVAELCQRLPRATLLLTTVYDPSDGTGQLPGLDWLGRLPLEYLERFNGHVRETAELTVGAALADAHRHFLGHGVTAAANERWYWARNVIEPNARGASEIRRVWWTALRPMLSARAA
jgi:lysophospholipase L1-like esterase